MQLMYRTDEGPQRQRSLPRDEEKLMAERGADYISTQLYSLLIEVSQLSAISYSAHPGFFRLNSLIWIWVQMKPEMIRTNLRILMARKGIASINQLAKAIRMNASFIGRTVGMEGPIGFCGWNTDNVFKLANALDARPELMMTTDLSARVQDEMVNWQI